MGTAFAFSDAQRRTLEAVCATLEPPRDEAPQQEMARADEFAAYLSAALFAVGSADNGGSHAGGGCGCHRLRRRRWRRGCRTRRGWKTGRRAGEGRLLS